MVSGFPDCLTEPVQVTDVQQVARSWSHCIPAEPEAALWPAGLGPFGDCETARGHESATSCLSPHALLLTEGRNGASLDGDRLLAFTERIHCFGSGIPAGPQQDPNHPREQKGDGCCFGVW